MAEQMDELMAERRALDVMGPIHTERLKVTPLNVLWSPQGSMPREILPGVQYHDEFVHTYKALTGTKVKIIDGLWHEHKVVRLPLDKKRLPPELWKDLEWDDINERWQDRDFIDIDIGQSVRDFLNLVPLQLILNNAYKDCVPALIHGQYIADFVFHVRVSGDVLFEDVDYVKPNASVQSQAYSEIAGHNQLRRVRGQCVFYLPNHCSLRY